MTGIMTKKRNAITAKVPPNFDDLVEGLRLEIANKKGIMLTKTQTIDLLTIGLNSGKFKLNIDDSILKEINNGKGKKVATGLL